MSRFAHVVLASLLFSLTVLDSNSLPHGFCAGKLSVWPLEKEEGKESKEIKATTAL